MNMKPVSSLLLASCLVVPSASAEIVECRDQHGLEKYQNFPCAIDSLGTKAAVSAPKQPMRALQPAGTASLVMSDENAPRPGMSMDTVRSAWGPPKATKVIKGMQTWYYNGPGQTWQAVHFDRTGNLRFVSHSPPPAKFRRD
jgi:hypothetical protein